MRFLIVKGDSLYIDPYVTMNGSLNTPVDVDDLYTPHGFFIPGEAGSWGILDYMEGGELPPPVERTRGFFVTHEEKIYSFSFGDGRPIVIQRFMVLPSLHWCASSEDNYVEAYAGLLHQDIDPMDAHAIVLETTPVHKNQLVRLSVKEIAAKLMELGFTKPLRYPQPEIKKDL